LYYRTLLRALLHTAASTTTHCHTAAHWHTLQRTLPHYRTLPHCLTLPHTVALPDSRTLPRALPHSHCSVHCRTLPLALPHTSACIVTHCRTLLPHYRTLPSAAALPHIVAHCCAHCCNTLPLAHLAHCHTTTLPHWHTTTLGTLSPTLVPVSFYFGYQSLSARVSISVLALSFSPSMEISRDSGRFWGILRNLQGFLGIVGDFILAIL
jgi:hypothetical protein